MQEPATLGIARKVPHVTPDQVAGLVHKRRRQPVDDALRFYRYSDESLQVEDEVVRLVGPFVPPVGVVGDAGVLVGCDPETVDGPFQVGFAVYLVQVSFVGDPLEAASVVDV